MNEQKAVRYFLQIFRVVAFVVAFLAVTAFFLPQHALEGNFIGWLHRLVAYSGLSAYTDPETRGTLAAIIFVVLGGFAHRHLAREAMKKELRPPPEEPPTPEEEISNLILSGGD